MADRRIRIVDCRDKDKKASRNRQNPGQITAAIRAILARGAIPIAIGTDEGGFIPNLRAFDDYDDLCIVHIDALIDWRNAMEGGCSSGKRRVSDMPLVKAMAQGGLRDIGSARRQIGTHFTINTKIHNT